MEPKLQLNDIVKYVKPFDEFESSLLLKVVNINEATNRIIVEIINMPNWGKINPTELLNVSDVEKVLKNM